MEQTLELQAISLSCRCQLVLQSLTGVLFLVLPQEVTDSTLIHLVRFLKAALELKDISILLIKTTLDQQLLLLRDTEAHTAISLLMQMEMLESECGLKVFLSKMVQLTTSLEEVLLYMLVRMILDLEANQTP